MCYTRILPLEIRWMRTIAVVCSARSHQSFNSDTPEAKPADTFAHEFTSILETGFGLVSKRKEE